MRSSLAGDEKQRGALAAIVFDRAVSSLNAAEAPIAIRKRGRVGVQKTLWIDERNRDVVRIFAAVLPGEDAARSRGANRICFFGPEVNEVARVTEPLIDDA